MGLLNHLLYGKCPQCGSQIHEKWQGSQHTNGKWNERVRFWCGHSIEYSPNFSAERVIVECKNMPTVKKKISEREQGIVKTIAYINKMKNVDKNFKERVIKELRDMNIDFM